MTNKFYNYLSPVVAGSTIRSDKYNSDNTGIVSAFESVELDLTKRVTLPATFTGNQVIPEVTVKDTFFYIDENGDVTLYPAATFQFQFTDINTKYGQINIWQSQVEASTASASSSASSSGESASESASSANISTSAKDASVVAANSAANSSDIALTSKNSATASANTATASANTATSAATSASEAANTASTAATTSTSSSNSSAASSTTANTAANTAIVARNEAITARQGAQEAESNARAIASGDAQNSLQLGGIDASEFFNTSNSVNPLSLGLGGNGIEITDWNSVYTDGSFFSQGPGHINTPDNSVSFWQGWCTTLNTGNVMQEVSPAGTIDNRRFIRRGGGSNWSDWYELFNSGNSVNPLDYGLGGEVVPLPNNNLDDVIATGFYDVVGTTLNLPPLLEPDNAVCLTIVRTADFMHQTVFNRRAHQTFQRYKQTTWSGWVEVLTSAKVTTSATDATAGKISKVGDFGPGATTSIIPSVTGIDGFFATGLYGMDNSNTNTPIDGGAIGSSLINMVWDQNAASQLFSSYSDSKLFYRTKSTSWRNWYEIFHTGNLPLTVTGNDTLVVKSTFTIQDLDASNFSVMELARSGGGISAHVYTPNGANTYLGLAYFNTDGARTELRVNSNGIASVHPAGGQFKNLLSEGKGTDQVIRESLLTLKTGLGKTIRGSLGGVQTIDINQDTIGGDAFMSFHNSGVKAVHFGLDGSSGKLSVGGWSMGANSYAIYHEGNKPTLAELGLSNVATQKTFINAGTFTVTRQAVNTYISRHDTGPATYTLNASTFIQGDMVYVTKHFEQTGTLTITTTSGSIFLPNTSGPTQTLESVGTVCLLFDGTNWLARAA
jgi:hypothetical protein